MSEQAKQKAKPSKWNNLILHLHPKLVPEKALKFTLTFGLGGMAALLFVILAFTGILLRFVYVPSPEKAYESIRYLQQEILFGNLVRNIHHWSATLLVVTSFLHMLRVLFTGAYNQKRASNWVIGVCMFLLVLISNFSGYLLPWDQLAYWAITVSTSMLSYVPLIGTYLNHIVIQGTEVGSSTLLVFYSMHTGVLPLAMVLLMSFHFWKTRKAGGVVIPLTTPDEKIKKVPVIPNLVTREFVVALVLIVIILLLSILFDAPLAEQANPSITPNPTKAPWYFMGFQELILHFHPIIAVVILPIGILIMLFYLPKIKNVFPVQGVWFQSEMGKKLGLIASILAIILTSIFVVLDEYIFHDLAIFKHGLLSFILFLSFIISGILSLKKRQHISRAELIQTLSIFIITTFIVLTLIGVFLRGAGMKLIF